MGGYEVQSGDEKQKSGYPGKPRRRFRSSGPRRRAARVKLVAISVLFWKGDRKKQEIATREEEKMSMSMSMSPSLSISISMSMSISVRIAVRIRATWP